MSGANLRGKGPRVKAPANLSGLLPFLAPYRLRIALALLFLVLAAAATLAFPVALRHLVDGGLAPGAEVSPGERLLRLRGYFGWLFAVALALALFSAVRFYLVSWLGERISADIRNRVYAHVLRQSPTFFETTQTGEVLSRLLTDTTVVQTVVGSSFSMGLRNGVMGLGAMAMLVYSAPKAMGLMLLAVVAVVLPTMWFGRRVRSLSRDSQDRIADSSALASEKLNAITTVQSYGAEAREAEAFTQASQFAVQTALRRSRARALLVAFVISASSAAMLWGLYLGTQAVLAGRMSAGELSQTVIYVLILAGAVAVLGEVYGDMQRAAGASERLLELLSSDSNPDTAQRSSPSSVLTFPREIATEAALTLQSAEPSAESAIEFEGVQFAYPSRPELPALQDLSLKIAAGQTIALVGASGAGKTTVLQLLLRFYATQGGRIRVQGQDILEMPLDALRGQMALVPQEATLFAASALDNIRYGMPNADEATVHRAAQAAFAHDFITVLPQGYHTFLGERGVRLSGGQRQRISIARAIVRNPPILLLDEATSALDAESERMVQLALEQAMQGRTTIVIAHRLATVQRADRIVVLDKGRIVEEGTHTQLLAQGGHYAHLASLQFLA